MLITRILEGVSWVGNQHDESFDPICKSQTGGPAPTANDSIDDFIDPRGCCSIAVLQYCSIDK